MRTVTSVATCPGPWLTLGLLVALAGCVQPERVARPAGVPAVAAPPVEIPAQTHITKLTAVTARVPERSEPPGLAGKLQRYRIAPGETLLTIARDGGLGFRELRDANPRIDEWEPRAGTVLLVPSRFILPRATAYRGLVVNLAEMRLYLFPVDTRPGERVPILTWPIGIGAEFAQSPLGPFTVRSKDENPTWVVPDSIYRRMENPRHVVPPGPDNPLGDYRIRTSVDVYAIHGTNDPFTVGRLTTHGCIRLYPEDIAFLYPLVYAGMPGEFLYEPVKVGAQDGKVYVEVHRDVYGRVPDLEGEALSQLALAGLTQRVDLDKVRAAVRSQTGVPLNVTREPAAPPSGSPPVRPMAGRLSAESR